MTTATTTIEDEARSLIQRGVPIIPCNGKVSCDHRGRPLDDWHTLPATIERVKAGLRGADNPAIGLKLGEYIDVEADRRRRSNLSPNFSRAATRQ